VPIAYAFSYPERINLTDDGTVKSLDLFALKDGMTFFPADDKVFKTIALARQASETGGSCPVVLNGANEVLVDMFLHGKIRFIEIQDTLERILNEHKPKFNLDLEGVLEEDRKIRDYVRKLLEDKRG
jgi:1-deoxy-D-xylulose-5-phosphate reductoisomerase